MYCPPLLRFHAPPVANAGTAITNAPTVARSNKRRLIGSICRAKYQRVVLRAGRRIHGIDAGSRTVVDTLLLYNNFEHTLSNARDHETSPLVCLHLIAI